MLGRISARRVLRAAIASLLLIVISLGGWMAAKPFLANHYQRQAEKALERQRYPQALAAYERALRYRPDSAALQLLAARTARQAGQYRSAREHLHKCRELQNGVTEEQQVESYLLRAQTGEVDEVTPYLMPYVLQEGPLTPLVLEGLARGYLGKYHTELAWRCLSRWNELQPTNVEALFWRGTWLAQQQNTRAAGEDFRKALGLDPERVDIRLAYAEVIRADKKFTEVAEQYRTVLRQEPDNLEAILGLAQAYLELGKTEEAGKQLAAVPADKRDSAMYLWVLGMVELRSDHPEKAEPLFRQSLDRDPRNLDACYNLMLCLTRLGRDAEAAEARARFEQLDRDQKRLIELTTRDMPAQPNNAELRCELGEIYIRLGLPDRGVHWLLAALKIDSGCRRAHERLRDYFESVGGPDAAEKAALHRQYLASHP